MTRLDSLEKASHWPSFKGLSLLQGHYLEASSSSAGGIWGWEGSVWRTITGVYHLMLLLESQALWGWLWV